MLLLISIGNSQGYPYENHIVFDAGNLSVTPDRETLAQVIAHEIHHTFFADLLPERFEPQELFC